MAKQAVAARKPLERVTSWRIRGGVRVPGVECLPPPQRLSVRRFVALMESMMGREGEPAEP